jgi:hypothetical protein
MFLLRCLPANRAEKRLNPGILIRRGEFDDQPDFLKGQLPGLVTAFAEALSHDTVVGCARGKSGVFYAVQRTPPPASSCSPVNQ